MLKRLLATVIVIVGVGLAARDAAANAITNPDLTLFDLTIVDNPGNFLASNSSVAGNDALWTDALGGIGGFTFGTTQSSISWNGSTGLINVFDSGLGLLLDGSITSFASNGAGLYNLMALLTTSSPLIGLGSHVEIQLSNFTHTADIFEPVPEPATLTLIGLGTAIAALRRRQRPRA